MVKTKPFDVAKHLKTRELIAQYLTEAFQSGDPAVVAKALGNIARSEGMTEIAEKAGVSRENLYRALSGETAPEFATVMKVLRALGIKLLARAKPDKAA